MSGNKGEISRRAVLRSAAAVPVVKFDGAEKPESAAEAAADWRAKTWTVAQLNEIRAADPENGRLPRRISFPGAKWIWLPCGRTLSNTFVLFRKAVMLAETPVRADAWIVADSRYRLFVNGERVQWGPAPCDPRQLDADPVDLKPWLRAGRNVIGVEVLFYGHGEGTWPGGKPGLLFHAALTGGVESRTVVSDETWLAFLDRAHPPGQYKRWFLRSLQEEFDARLHPSGWTDPERDPDDRWLRAAVIRCDSDKPPSSAPAPYCGDTLDTAAAGRCALRVREIPAVRETEETAAKLAGSGRVLWRRDPDDWFDFRLAGSFEARPQPAARQVAQNEWELPATPDARTGVYATFEMPVQMVGFPRFTIDAPDGTVVELITQESHDAAKTAWLDTHLFAWSRWICREGVNDFEAFDYESLRWLQVHVRGAGRAVRIRNVGLRRRQYPWAHEPHVKTSDAALERLLAAAVNTVRNSVIETAVDGMGRERQQYSGDGGHQLHAVRYAFGDTHAPRRFLRTFSEGQMKDGYFPDCWPAYDRLARVAQKQMDGAYWGPLLDHGVGFAFDCSHHYLETGDLDAVVEAWPRIRRFATYLTSLIAAGDLIPVVDLGIPTVWMDHDAFREQKHKQCAFNLYVAAMFRDAVASLAEQFGETGYARECRGIGDRILVGAVRRYWSNQRKMFVDNLPWAEAEGGVRLSDRTLAMSVLFDLCPGGATGAAVQALASAPAEMGISYPCNANWRYQALARGGVIQPVLDDLRRRWATMRSVVENCTIQENWNADPDSSAQWSHSGVAPLYVTFMDIAGIRPSAPGFAKCSIRPQLGDLPDLELTAWTVRGPIEFAANKAGAGHRVRVSLPAGCEGEILLPGRAPKAVPAGGKVELATG